MATSNANVVTKESKVLEALQSSSKGLTAAQIEARFGVGNARSTVSALRMKGFAIYANQNTDTKGRTKTFYRLGTYSFRYVVIVIEHSFYSLVIT